MKKLLILGAGTAGTIMANKMVGALDRKQWHITVVDRDGDHHYQPGYLFVPFGIYSPQDIIRPRRNYLPKGVDVIFSGIETIDHAKNQVNLSNAQVLDYDFLVIATGAHPDPSETEGLGGAGWRRNVFDFYTLEGATALYHHLKEWKGGRMVINIAEMPIKCPVAPLEFAFLADWWFTTQGIRDKVEIEYVTPLSAAFTKPKAAELFGGFLGKKNIKLIPDFALASVDPAANKIVSWDEREIPYDLLISVPVNKGDEAIARSGMGDELNFIPTDKHTLRSKVADNIFVIGDATDLPSSKAGSVAHFQADILFENLLDAINGRPLSASFDGHANCFIESGFNKGLLIDFNYETEPLTGKFPLPGIGPMPLLKESRLNHWGKMMFRWIYWNMLLPARPIPLMGSAMSMRGKIK